MVSGFLRRLIALLALLLVALGWLFPAYAADMAVKARPYVEPVAAADWRGMYLDFYGVYAANTTDADLAMNGVSIANIGTSPHGPGLGGAIGYFFQLGTPEGIVIGPRLSGMWANMQGSGGIGDVRVSNATNWLGDADLCLGVPLGPRGRLLAYGCGGFAFGGAKPNLRVGTVEQGVKDTSTGFNADLGLRYLVTPNFGLFIEGGYYQLGDRQVAIPLTETATLTSNNPYHFWVQRFGGSLKF